MEGKRQHMREWERMWERVWERARARARARTRETERAQDRVIARERERERDWKRERAREQHTERETAWERERDQERVQGREQQGESDSTLQHTTKRWKLVGGRQRESRKEKIYTKFNRTKNMKRKMDKKIWGLNREEQPKKEEKFCNMRPPGQQHSCNAKIFLEGKWEKLERKIWSKNFLSKNWRGKYEAKIEKRRGWN